VAYLTAKKLVYLIFVGFEKTVPGFDQRLPAKCSVFPLLFGAEHYPFLEIAVTDFRKQYLKVDLFYIEFCNNVAI
jgi:hypothetical protein